jgi:hypothetical protein
VAALGSLIMVVALAWFSRGSSPRRRTQFADIAVYGFAAAGLLYVVQLGSEAASDVLIAIPSRRCSLPWARAAPP